MLTRGCSLRECQHIKKYIKDLNLMLTERKRDFLQSQVERQKMKSSITITSGIILVAMLLISACQYSENQNSITKSGITSDNSVEKEYGASQNTETSEDNNAQQQIIQETEDNTPDSDIGNFLEDYNEIEDEPQEDNSIDEQENQESIIQPQDSGVTTSTSTTSTSSSTTTTSTLTPTTTTTTIQPAEDNQQSSFSDSDLISKIKSYKPIFTEHKDMETPSGSKQYVFLDGTGKVLLSAPHAVNHIREGSVKINDYCTGPIANTLHDITGAPLIYLNYKSQDPNYYDDTEYKETLGKFLDEHPEIELVIDIHGAAESHDWDVDLGTMNGNSMIKFKDLESKITGFMNSNGINTVSSNDFTAAGQNTITKFSAGKNRDAVQIEINRKFRCSTDGDDTKILRALEDVVEYYR